MQDRSKIESKTDCGEVKGFEDVAGSASVVGRGDADDKTNHGEG